MKKVTIVTPVYNEEENLPDYFDVLEKVLFSNEKYDFEVLLIDDGSRDRSWDIICAGSARDKRFKGIKLSKNHGSHHALAAGFSFARGDAVATLACDLQDPPDTINRFLEQWEKGFDIVWGVREKRDDSWSRILASKFFERLIRKWAAPPGSQFATGSFFLMDRKVLDYYNNLKEQNRVTFAIVAYLGFTQKQVFYERKARQKGKSGWNFTKLFKTLYDAVIAFSHVPVRIITFLSILALTAVIPIGGYVLYLYFTGRTANIGWVSVILTVTLFGSLILFNLSFILEYLMRVYSNTTQRPIFIISEITENLDARDQ
jgi:dolichol-phosphate mannosyltransferase